MDAAFEVYSVVRRHIAEADVEEWRWRLRAANGEVLASGESFTTRSDAWRAVHTVARAVLDAVAHRIETGQWEEEATT